MHESSPSRSSERPTTGSRRGFATRVTLAIATVATAGLLGASVGAAAPSGELTLGSNYSDPTPKAALQQVVDAFVAENPGVTVKVNTVDHNTYQENINAYLQGRPDDVFAWFAGYRMQFFAQRGLAGDISDVWTQIGSEQSSAFKGASTGLDGKQYFVPFYNYPWAVFYRKSVFKKNGYKIPTTLAQLVSLSKEMQKDGLVPIAFADKDGWPAMGTFDYLNVRTNGHAFHVNLMAGRESWTSPKVKRVFETWKSLLPYHQKGALGRTWQDAAKSVVNRKAGMYLLGGFVGQQFTGAAYKDLDFFPFPQINPAFARDTVEAPIDGFMMSRSPKNPEAAKAFLKFLSTAKAQQIYLGADPNNIAASSRADQSKYNVLQKKYAKLIGGSKHISQFLDRDTRPDFASTVMIPSLQKFIRNPNDIDGLLRSIETQKKAIFTS